MKVLITGSNGLLGQKLLQTLHREQYDLIGCDLADSAYITKIPHDYIKLDLTNRKSTIDVIKECKAGVIILTAGMTNVDGCEREKAKCWQANVTTTENILLGAMKVNSKVVFISTDYIFDGRQGPYDENAVPNPINYYGRSKLAAENLIRGSKVPWLIARTIVLYGTGVKIKSSFVTWLLKELRAGKPVNIVTDQWGNVTLVDDLAAGIERCILLDRQGLYNMGGKDFMSRFEFSRRIAEFFDLDMELIHPITTASLKQDAPRPLKSGLITDKAERELFIKFRNTEQSLEIYMAQEKDFTSESL
jgi:dTDP-4-dehydrorhamnose reductase